MSEAMGGYIFVAATEENRFVDIMLQTLDILHEPEQILYLETPGHANLGPVPTTREEILATLQSTREHTLSAYRISCYIAGFYHTFRFEIKDSFIAIRLATEPPSFKFPEGDPAKVEVFAQQWVALCDSVRAIGAYYVNQWNAVNEHFSQSMLDEIKSTSTRDFTNGVFWLSYLGANIVNQDEQQNDIATITDKVQILPSGALVIYGHRYNPVLTDERELPLEASWMLRHLEIAAAVPGVSGLITQIQGAMQGLAAGMQSLAARRKEEEAATPPGQLSHSRIQEALHGSLKEKDELERAARDALADIRALWAAAYKRPGLLGVNQTVSLSRANGQDATIVVPIIAEQGQEWLLVANHDPRASKGPTWTRGDEQLASQVRDLLDAAPQHSIAGQLPRVVVFCWKGIADDMRAALVALGAQVEIAPISVPLLEP